MSDTLGIWQTNSHKLRERKVNGEIFRAVRPKIWNSFNRDDVRIMRDFHSQAGPNDGMVFFFGRKKILPNEVKCQKDLPE